MSLRQLVLLAPLLLAGCGYSTGLSLREPYASVGLEIFENDSPVRRVERDLHDAMSQVVRNRVEGTLRDPRGSDLVVRGRILEVRYRPGIRTSGNQAVETGLIMIVRGVVVDRATGEPVAGPTVARAQVGYALEVPFAEEDAHQRAVQHVAERLVLDLFSRDGVRGDLDG